MEPFDSVLIGGIVIWLGVACVFAFASPPDEDEGESELDKAIAEAKRDLDRALDGQRMIAEEAESLRKELAGLRDTNEKLRQQLRDEIRGWSELHHDTIKERDAAKKLQEEAIRRFHATFSEIERIAHLTRFGPPANSEPTEGEDRVSDR